MDPGIATVVATTITAVLALGGTTILALATRDGAIERRVREVTAAKDSELNALRTSTSSEIRALRSMIYRLGGNPDEA